MALRSSLSSLASRTATPAPATDADDSVEGISSKEAAAPAPAPRRGHIAPAPAEQPADAAPVRGRPRLSDEEKAARAAERAAKPKAPRRARATSAVDGLSASELRAAIKDVEHEAKAIKEQVDAAVAKFQPKIDALRTRHAELSAQLAQSLFR